MVALAALLASACAVRSPEVSVEASCVPTHGYACDWVAAFERAAQGDCDEQLRAHWSAGVRRVCAGEAFDRRWGLIHNDHHFDDPQASSPLPGQELPEPLDPKLIRPFRFPAEYAWPKLSSKRDVTVAIRTAVGVLVGINQGEWGGALIWLPERHEAQLLARVPVRLAFEGTDGTVYVIAHDYFRDVLYTLERSGPDRAARWRLSMRFRLPGDVREARRTDAGVVLRTEVGTALVRNDGTIEVGP